MRHPIPANEYVDLSPLIDVVTLTKLHLEVCKSLLKAEVTYANSGVPLQEFRDQIPGFLGPKWQETFSENLAEEDKKEFLALPPKEKRKFAALHSGLFTMLAVMVVNQNSPDKRSSNANQKHPVNYDLFSYLIKWVEDQNIFDNTGRISLFITPPGFPRGSHTDADEDYRVVEEFLWLCPANNKNMVLSSNGVDRTTSSPALWFNSNQVHGGSYSLGHTYSIRVDGKFNKRTLDFLHTRLGWSRDNEV